MNFQLTKEQEKVRELVRKFALAEVEPIAADIDKKMIKIIEDAQNLLYRQYWAPAVWEITAAASIIVAGPFGPIVIGMIQNLNEEAWMNQQTVKLSNQSDVLINLAILSFTILW